MTIKVCVSVSATTIPTLLSRVEDAEKMGADLIEVRLDRLRSHNALAKLAKSATPPLIATNRPRSEKGYFKGKEEDRLGIIQQAVEAGFQYADLEAATNKLERAITSVNENGGRIILSHHDYSATPDLSKLEATLSLLQKQKPEISKIVTTAKLPQDNLSILEFLEKNHRNNSLVGFAMGKVGIWSRLMAPFYGSAFTYASLGTGMETAPGQPTISQLRTVYEALGLE